MPVNFKVPEQQQAPLQPGATSPQQSAYMKVSDMNNTQTAVNKIGGIRRRKIRRGGGTIAIQPTNTTTINVNPLLANVATSNVRAQAAGEFDNKASVKGGSKRRRTRRRTKKSRGRRHKKTRRYRH